MTELQETATNVAYDGEKLSIARPKIAQHAFLHGFAGGKWPRAVSSASLQRREREGAVRSRLGDRSNLCDLTKVAGGKRSGGLNSLEGGTASHGEFTCDAYEFCPGIDAART
jgi:hypothetical protein